MTNQIRQSDAVLLFHATAEETNLLVVDLKGGSSEYFLHTGILSGRNLQA